MSSRLLFSQDCNIHYSVKTTVCTGILSESSRLQSAWMLLLFDFGEFIDVFVDVMGDF